VSAFVKCVLCGCLQSRVVDSRLSEDGTSIRRRRECEACGRRFTTYEKIEMIPIMVVKRDKTRETFDSAKLRLGVIKACQKRPVSLNQIDELVRSVEKRVYASGDTEVTSQAIGEIVMDELKQLDEVAYVRFASVYRQFKDIETFMTELSKLLTDSEKGNADGSTSSGKY
jgi:transcriptional repressor NrdR